MYHATWKGRDVAVKRCISGEHGEMTVEQLKSLEREINTCRALSHPNIVKYIGCSLAQPNLALVLEFVPGANLFDLLYIQQVSYDAATRLHIAKQLSDVIAYLHSCNPLVIHRDLKTQNVILTPENNIKLVDFGKTKPMHRQSLCLDEDNGGSPRYMAPECYIQNGMICTI